MKPVNTYFLQEATANRFMNTLPTMSPLKDRLRLAMDGPPRVSQAALARACKIAAPSVNNWLSGRSQEIKGANLLAAARLLNVTPEWLATGRGPMRTTLNDSAGAENYSRKGRESHRMALNEDILHEAITLLLHDELHAGVYPPRAKTRRLVELYEWVAAEGGRLTNASNLEYERQVLARSQGATDGGSSQKGVDSR